MLQSSLVTLFYSSLCLDSMAGGLIGGLASCLIACKKK